MENLRESMTLAPENGAEETAKGTLRLAIIGLGKIGLVHLKNLQNMEGTTVVAVAEPEEGRAELCPDDVPAFPHWRDVFSLPEVDAAIVTLPHSMHVECAQYALEHGKHVFLEKPLATKLAEARALVEAASRAGKILMVNMTHRFYPTVRLARRMVQDGVVGKIVTVHDHYMEVIDRSEFPSWFFDPHLAGGGVTMTDSIHLVDRVSWLIGEPLFLKGQVARVLDPGSRVEDCSEIICQSASGISATIGSFFCFDSEKTVADRLSIFGTKGTLVVYAWSHLEWTPHGGGTERIEAYPDGLSGLERVAYGHCAALSEFIQSIRQRCKPEADAASVLNALEVVQEFYDNLPVF